MSEGQIFNEWHESFVHSAKMDLNLRFPGIGFSLLSDEGSSAIVFVGGDGYVYKYYRNNDVPTYRSKEAETISLGSSSEVFPKLIAFYEHPTNPVVVMEKVDIQKDWFDSATPESLVKEFIRVADIFNRLRFMPGDTEPVFSTNKKHVVFIDVAGIDNLKDITKLRYVHEKGVDAEDVYPGFNDEQVFRIQLYARLIGLLTDNGIWVDQGFIKSIIEPDVLEGDMARITQQLKEYQAHRLKKNHSAIYRILQKTPLGQKRFK